MGHWTLQSVTPDIRDRNDVYGHYFSVRFRLKYTPSTFGSFTEMPRLEWKETITMIERNKGEWWQYIGDQFARDPNSQTFLSWVGRYNYAHYAVRRGLYGPDDSVRLYDKNGAHLPKDTFPNLPNPKEQAEVVRAYLKKHGGIIDVTVVDKPGINKPNNDPTVHKNRILTFDCGLRGSGLRVKAYQHLTVDGSLPEHSWSRTCVLQSISPPFNTAGLRRVQPPADVTIVKPFTGGARDGTYL